MPVLNKESILAVQDLQTKEVPVPAWGGSVRLRGLSAGERESLEQEILDKNGKVVTKNLRAKLIVRCAVDEDGNRLFTDADIEELNKKSSAAIDLLFLESQKLNGMSDKDVEDLAGN